MGMVVYNDNQIEDARKGIEKDLQERLHRFISVRLVEGTGVEIKFVAHDLGFCHAKMFDELCSAHLARVANINYDDPGLLN